MLSKRTGRNNPRNLPPLSLLLGSLSNQSQQQDKMDSVVKRRMQMEKHPKINHFAQVLINAAVLPSQLLVKTSKLFGFQTSAGQWILKKPPRNPTQAL